MGWVSQQGAQKGCGSLLRAGTHGNTASPSASLSCAVEANRQLSSATAPRTVGANKELSHKKHRRVVQGKTISPSNRALSRSLAQQSKQRRRSEAWASDRASIDQKRKLRAFLSGSKKAMKKYTPTDDDIAAALHKTATNPDSLLYTSLQPSRLLSGNSQAMNTEQREMRHLLELLNEGGLGYMPAKKTDGWIRIMFENWNSLGVFTHRWKVDRLNHLIRQLQVDVIAGCESQCDWSFVDRPNQFLDIIAPGSGSKGIAAHNTTERLCREQMGGTAIAALGRLCDIVDDVGTDKTGLARWSWIKLGRGTRTTRIISAYLPCKPGKTARGRTVWEQHLRFFQARGDFRNPSTLFIDGITTLIRQWRQVGEEVILLIDSNQDVYKGPLAASLAQTGLDMRCLMEPVLGEKVPNSHFRGSGKLTTMFGTPGLVQGHAMCYPHWYGIGDHRVFLLEISASSLFGGEYPTILTPSSRRLNCKISRIRRQYCKRLDELTSRHQMATKQHKLTNISLPHDESCYVQLHDKWDRELGEFMRAAENTCTKFKTCALEYSPTVGQWLQRRAVLKWLLRWHDGKVPHTGNLCRAARRSHIANPLSLSRQDIEQRLQAVLHELFQLRTQAPELRRQHLRWRLSIAKDQQDEEASREIKRIIARESARQKQRNINRVVRDPRGRSVFSVRVSLPDGHGEATHSHQDAVEQVCGEHLGSRFSLGKRAPLSAEQMVSQIGNLSDTMTAQLILENKFDFSADWDQATVDLLQSAARLRLEIEDIPATDQEVTIEEFQDFWKTCRESTSSSKSGRHFGHYKAICNEPHLIRLHTQNINLAACRGNPLPRWRHGVTVLLEKIAGNNHIDKLRAICLLEADFNWWLKVIFAKRMMHRMKASGVMPVEQGAVSGKTTADSSLMKQLFIDQANILHATCAISSNDAANCYDAVNHSAGSFALQAMRVPLTFIKCYLLCVQTMQFYLKTGYGLATQSYGGSQGNPYMGLTQGSGAAPAAWSAVSTVILSAYKSRGHGALFASAWSGMVLLVAALLYVDDTDLLHMSRDERASESDFVVAVQTATSYWAKLLQATGGNLKPEKCYWYLLSYKFVCGKAQLKPLRELRQYQLLIPQPLGKMVPITLKAPDDASEVLGVWTSPSSDGKRHLQHMLAKGYRWSKRVMSSPLTPAEVWHSYRTQAYPAVSYGLLTLMTTRVTLDKAFSDWYYSFLPALGVNRNITTAWRTLPSTYQGLGLPQMSLEKLALSLQYLQRHWDSPTEYGKALRCIFELMQVDIGLCGNFLLRDYKKFHILANHSWFKILWELLDHYHVSLHLSNDTIPAVRQCDKVFMEEVVNKFPPSQWVSINRARKFFQVYFLSQVVNCDGSTVNPNQLQGGYHIKSRMVFPTEQPTPQDYKIWREAVQRLTSPKLRLSPSLGKHVRLPYDETYWLTNESRDFLLQKTAEVVTHYYLPRDGQYRTRGRKSYHIAPLPPTLPTTTHVATIKQLTPTSVTVHSQSLIAQQPNLRPNNLRQSLEALGSLEVWRNLRLDDDGNWLLQAYAEGTLTICHDGSYMPNLDTTRCSAATVFLGMKTGQIATVTYCEQTSVSTASNYRGELIGGVLATLLLLALAECTESRPPCTLNIYCDNLGVVSHGNNYLRPLPERQVQHDVLSLLRRNILILPNTIQYKHVYGHQDNGTTFSNLTLPQQLNVMADQLAKSALLQGIECASTTGPFYPMEPVRIMVSGKKATSSIRSTLYEAWGKGIAQELFQRRHIVSNHNFHFIAWDNVARVMSSYPQMYRTWVTKHISGFCGNNRQLSRIDPSTVNRCPCCHHPDDSTSHLTRCLNPGRKAMFTKSVDELLDWMEDTGCVPGLISCLETYLSSIGEGSMIETAKPYPHLEEWAIEHDILGWDNFLEGRISKKLFHLQQRHLVKLGSRIHIHTWARKFTRLVLAITHRQWLFRNARIHIRLQEHKTPQEHQDIMDSVAKMILLDPETLLPQHRFLLEQDFKKLGEGHTIDRQYWLANVTSAWHANRVISHHITDATTLPPSCT